MVTVLPGLELTLANDFLLTILFISEDFPTFERPEKQNSGVVDGNNCSAVPKDFSYSAIL
jgi:hypothetical protein